MSLTIVPSPEVAIEEPVTVDIPSLPTIAFQQITVGTTEEAIPAAALAGRKTISIKALAANGAEVYVGETGVTALTGYELAAGESIDIDADDTVALFAISASGSQKVSVAELA